VTSAFCLLPFLPFAFCLLPCPLHPFAALAEYRLDELPVCVFVAALDELMERGYEDTYRQFIEPFLGASGERISQLGRAMTD